MSSWDGYTDEMGHLPYPSDEDLERLLSGLAPADDGLDDLASLVRDVRSAYEAPAVRAVEDRHVLPIVAAAQLATDKGDPAVRPASKAHGSAGQTSGLPKWRRRTVLSSLFASLGTKVAGVAFAATAAAGGVAATGNLPDAAQTAVANAVEHVGIHIPNPGGASADHRQDAEHRQDEGKPEDAGQPEHAGKSVSDAVKEAIENSTPGEDRGAVVSDAADQNRQDGEHTQGQPTDIPSVSPAVPDSNPNGYGPDNHPTGKP